MHKSIIIVFIQVISEAGDLEKEKDSSTFVSAYTAINNSLEQMFIDLLLLMDGCTTNIKDEQKATIDVSGVVEALKVVAIKESEGVCVGSYVFNSWMYWFHTCLFLEAITGLDYWTGLLRTNLTTI